MSADHEAQSFGQTWDARTISGLHLQAVNSKPWPVARSIHSDLAVSSWLEQARDHLTRLTSDQLAGLPLESRRSLAAASLQFWQARAGISAQDIYETSGNFTNAKARIDRYIAANGMEELIGDLDLATKAQAALTRSPLYDKLIGRAANDIVALYTEGLKAPKLFSAVVKSQTAVWQAAAPEDCGDLPFFRVITEQADLYPDAYLPQPDGTGMMYMGPQPDGTPHWLNGKPRQQIWLIAHEHLHHIQYHLYQRYEAGALRNLQLHGDVEAMMFNRDFAVPHFIEDIFGNNDRDNPRFSLWLSAHKALYLSKPREAAAFKLHNAIIDGLNDRLGSAEIPKQPQKPAPRNEVLTAPSRAPR